MAKRNPFVKEDAATEEVREEMVLPDPLLGQALMETGPSDPRALPISPDDVFSDAWPRREVSAAPSSHIAVMGLHGGAGASTMATLLGPDVLDHGQTWPVPPEGEPLGVLAVCRSHWRGLEAADAFTMQWAAEMLPGATLLGLVVIDDGPKLSDAQSKAVRQLLKRTPRGIHVPWVETWRHVPAGSGRIPGRITRITRTLRVAAANL